MIFNDPQPRVDPELAAILAAGSKSFAAAARLLPPRVRMPATAVYAFCREADDAIDTGSGSVATVAARLDRIYGGRPAAVPVETVMAGVVSRHALPRGAFDAMVEGFAWDAAGRSYQTLDELVDYCVRVASTVGVLMALLMGERRPSALARACDLGVAMQLTNIARDVGEDARMGRIYLPREWLDEQGIEPQSLLDQPRWTPEVGYLTRRLLASADELYRRADAGIAALPWDCRPAIQAARRIYADIGRVVAGRLAYDSVGARAHTGKPRKLWLVARSVPAIFEAAAPSGEPALPGAQFLIDLAAVDAAAPASRVQDGRQQHAEHGYLRG